MSGSGFDQMPFLGETRQVVFEDIDLHKDFKGKKLYAYASDSHYPGHQPTMLDLADARHDTGLVSVERGNDTVFKDWTIGASIYYPKQNELYHMPVDEFFSQSEIIQSLAVFLSIKAL